MFFGCQDKFLCKTQIVEKEQMNIKSREWLIIAFYPLLFLNALLGMYGFKFDRILVFPLVLILIITSFNLIVTGKRNTGSKLVVAFILYNLLSIFFYSYNGRPLDCFIHMLFPFVIPILFFFWGNRNTIDAIPFYKCFVILCFGSFLYGIYLYAFMPSYYLSYLTDIYNNAWHTGAQLSEESVLLFSRFSSFFGSSYAISYLSIPSLCIAAGLINISNKKGERIYFYITIGISWVAAVLCQQRVAMIVASVYLLFVILNRQEQRKSQLLYILLILPIFYFVYMFFFESGRLFDVSDMLTGRLERMDLNDAYEGSRMNQYTTSLMNMDNYLLGDGLGAASSFARKYGFAGVTDGEYVRIFAENGLIGVSIFIALIIYTVKKMFEKWKECKWEILVVLYFFAASFVSNSLSINLLYAPIFWFCMGRLWINRKN